MKIFSKFVFEENIDPESILLLVSSMKMSRNMKSENLRIELGTFIEEKLPKYSLSPFLKTGKFNYSIIHQEVTSDSMSIADV